MVQFWLKMWFNFWPTMLTVVLHTVFNKSSKFNMSFVSALQNDTYWRFLSWSTGWHQVSVPSKTVEKINLCMIWQRYVKGLGAKMTWLAKSRTVWVKISTLLRFVKEPSLSWYKGSTPLWLWLKETNVVGKKDPRFVEPSIHPSLLPMWTLWLTPPDFHLCSWRS